MPRTTNELKALLKQYLSANSGTKPFKGTIKTGFITGGSVKKSALSTKQLNQRSDLKERIRAARKAANAGTNQVMTDRQKQRSRLSANQGNPTVPTSPPNRIPTSSSSGNQTPPTKPPFRPGGPGTTPPTKPVPSSGIVGAVRSAIPSSLAGNGRGLQSRGNQAKQVSALIRKRKMS